MGLYIETNGNEETIKPKEGKHYGLKELQNLVGVNGEDALIELVPLSGGEYMVCDEEGLIKGLQFNTTASLMARNHIVGNVVVCLSKEIK
jgi:hypothetical protein